MFVLLCGSLVMGCGLSTMPLGLFEILAMIMKKQKIAGNDSINDMIYYCFEFLEKEDTDKFLLKFNQQPHNSDQIMHTFRELVLGAFLSSSGYKVKYDFLYGGQTPDWCILDDNKNIKGLVELTNIHIDKTAENKIKSHLNNNSSIIYPRDEYKNNVNRLYQNILEKAQVYKELVRKNQLPYVVAIFIEFYLPINYEDELRPCLFDTQSGIFNLYPELSGVVAFEEKCGSYILKYFTNTNAIYSLILSDGIFKNRKA